MIKLHFVQIQVINLMGKEFVLVDTIPFPTNSDNISGFIVKKVCDSEDALLFREQHIDFLHTTSDQFL